MSEVVNINFEYKDGRKRNPFSMPEANATRFIEFDGARFERRGEEDVWVEVGPATNAPPTEGRKKDSPTKSTVTNKRGK